MGVEALTPMPQQVLQPGVVFAHLPVSGSGERAVEQRPHHRRDVAAVTGQAVIDESGFAFFGDQPGVLEHAEMARHAGLRHGNDTGQLRHVDAFLGEDAQQAKAGAVSEHPEQRSGVSHGLINLHI